MNYRFNWDDGVFAVPDSVTGQAFRLASGKWVKVLIYMLSKKELPDDPADIGVTAEDVEEALAYWEEQGIISKTEMGSIRKPAAEKPKKEIKIIAAEPEQITAQKRRSEIERSKPAKALLPTEIAQRMAESEEINFLMKSAEMTLQKPLSWEDQRTILWFCDHLGFSADIILMLIGFCCSINKPGMAYIQKVAEDWFDKEISTHEQAENEILNMQKKFSYASRIQTRLKLPDKISKAQKKHIDQWAQWDISEDMVELAYDKTLDSKGRIDFNYMNGIIKKWYENNITELSAAEAFDSRPKKAAEKKPASNGAPTTNTSAPSFDLSAILEHAKNNTPTV